MFGGVLGVFGVEAEVGGGVLGRGVFVDDVTSVGSGTAFDASEMSVNGEVRARSSAAVIDTEGSKAMALSGVRPGFNASWFLV